MDHFKEVITDKGILAYEIIDGKSYYDYLVVYRKYVKKTSPKFFGLIPEKEVVNYIPMRGTNSHYVKTIERHKYMGDGDISCFYLDRERSSEERLSDIKSSIEKCLKIENSFNPEWDGIMISDKAKLRELLIDDLLDD